MDPGAAADEEGGEVPPTEMFELPHHAQAEGEGSHGAEGGPQLGEQQLQSSGRLAGEYQVGEDSQQSAVDFICGIILISYKDLVKPAL